MIALFFDTETTGFKKGSFIPEIVQIGALLQDTESKRVLGEINMIIKPENPIPAEVSAIHGIDDQLAAAFGMNNRRTEIVFGMLAEKADVVVAHNIQFDVGIIKDAWPIASTILDTKEQFCTMINCSSFNMPRTHAGKSQYTKLAVAYKWFYGEDFDNAHDAMADVRACRDVYFKIMESRNVAA